MKRLVIVIIGILIAASIFVVINTSRTSQKKLSPIPKTNEAKPTPLNEKLAIYNDPSGFAFQYPDEGITVSQKENDDKQTYAFLELSMAKQPETISIKAEESELTSIDDWFKGNKKTSVFGTVTKTKLADLDARQFQANNARITIALDQGVLFTITTNAKKDSQLMRNYETVIKSFSFVQPTPSQSGQSNDSGGSVEEEEEVVK